jgi:hypothetical protein
MVLKPAKRWRLLRPCDGARVVSVIDNERSPHVYTDVPAEKARRWFHEGTLDWSFEYQTYCRARNPKPRGRQ